MKSSLEGQKILITGAGGFIGWHLAKALMPRNHVTGTMLDGELNPFLHQRFLVDVSKPKELLQLRNHKFDYVFHLAGIADVQKSIADPISDFEVNAKGTLNVLDFFRGQRIKSLTFASSVSVLSSRNPLPLKEGAVYGPSTPYAAAKMASEGYFMTYYKCYNVPCRVIRLFNAYGPGRKGLVIYDFIKKLMLDPGNLSVMGDGMQIRDFLYVDDVVRGISLVAEHGNDGEVYHLGSGQPVSIKELAQIVIQTMNLNDTKLHFSNEPYAGEFLKWYAEISKIKSIGFRPEVGLSQGIAKTIEWIKSN